MSEKQLPYMMSLYEYLGRPAGSELGKQVAEVAIKLKETIKNQEISTPNYTGKVLTYRREFLDDYFGNKKPVEIPQIVEDEDDDLPF